MFKKWKKSDLNGMNWNLSYYKKMCITKLSMLAMKSVRLDQFHTAFVCVSNLDIIGLIKKHLPWSIMSAKSSERAPNLSPSCLLCSTNFKVL